MIRPPISLYSFSIRPDHKDVKVMLESPTDEGNVPGPAAAQILRHAVRLLDRWQPRIVKHPTWCLYWALTAAGAVSGSPKAEAVHEAVVAEMQRRHPDWPVEGSLIRLVDEEGSAALREVLVAAAGGCELTLVDEVAYCRFTAGAPPPGRHHHHHRDP
ncbi:MAG TPA: hypothetical protein VMW80_02885 [Candidatus Dormibacteraeota bacterium]|nr:hypothetical protein [Candidatus Dormibacteraeota bacterium]